MTSFLNDNATLYSLNVTCPLPTAIRLGINMSGTLEKVSSMKAYGGDLIKYKFKVGRVICSFPPAWRLLTGIGNRDSTVCRSRWPRCVFQSVLTCKLRKRQCPSAFLFGGFNLHGRQWVRLA